MTTAFNNDLVFETARRQSAIDINCSPDDFLKTENVIVTSKVSDKRRVYYSEPIACQFVSYGSNVVVSVKDEYKPLAREYVDKFTFYHCFETPNMHWLNERFERLGQRVCYMAEYYLPDLNRLRPLKCRYKMKVITREHFGELYLPQWSNALCAQRKEYDMLAVGAYDGDKLIGMAGCSADCDEMWQIGIDVLPEYRRQGIASALTSTLAAEALERGKIPFYCCAWSNLASKKNAIKSGFTPAWVEMTVKPAKIVEKENR